MMLAVIRRRANNRRGFTLAEVLIAMGLLGIVAYATSMIYFSVLNIHNKQMWRLAPYDEATAAVNRISEELQEAIRIDSFGASWVIVTLPEKDANRNNVLVLGPDGYVPSEGDCVMYYLSDETGALGAQGNCLWKAVKPQGESNFVPRIKIASDIHPELNPVDPDTGQPRPMFKYHPDEVRLWGVELWITATALVKGETMSQTAHSEVYLRNI